MVIGDWNGTAFELPKELRDKAGAVAYLARRYSSPARGVTVSVLLFGGDAGSISSHTPEVCYPGAGYTLDSPSVLRLTDGRDDHRPEFRTAVATRSGTDPSVVRIFWGWNAWDGWVAPENPRWKFAGIPALCKLYVVRETGGAAGDPAADPCNDFLRAFLPELDRIVFATPDGSAGTIVPSEPTGSHRPGPARDVLSPDAVLSK